MHDANFDAAERRSLEPPEDADVCAIYGCEGELFDESDYCEEHLTHCTECGSELEFYGEEPRACDDCEGEP